MGAVVKVDESTGAMALFLCKKIIGVSVTMAFPLKPISCYGILECEHKFFENE